MAIKLKALFMAYFMANLYGGRKQRAIYPSLKLQFTGISAAQGQRVENAGWGWAASISMCYCAYNIPLASLVNNWMRRGRIRTWGHLGSGPRCGF